MPRPNISSYSVASGVGSLVQLSVPSGVNSGNLILSIILSSQSTTHTTPSGWTKLGSELSLYNYSSLSSYNFGGLFYKTATSESGNYNFTIDSGKYVGAVLNISNGTSINSYQIYNSGRGCSSCVLYGARVNNTGSLSLNVVGSVSPLITPNFLSIYEAPFNGLYHSGVYLGISSGHLNYISTGNYSPPYSLLRGTGGALQNTGSLIYQPPSIYFCGAAVEIV